MRKLLPVLLCVLLLVMAVLPVQAASAGMQLGTSKSSVSRGDTFTVTVNLSNTEPLSNGGIVFSYDASVFEMVGGDHNITGATGQVSAGNNGGVFAMETDTVVSGRIFTVTMRVKADAAFGSYTISGSANLSGGGNSISCSVSGTTVSVVCSHSYGSSTNVNSTSHQSTCSVCGDVKTSDHTWDAGTVTKPASCKETGIRKKTCTACGATTEETIQKTSHKYSISSVNGSTHTQTCSVCGAEAINYHNYSGWKHDKDNHYRICSTCGHKADQAAHVPGPEATETTNQTCTVCSRILKPMSTHEHSFLPEWESDSVNHWHNCTDCDEKDSEEAHVFENNCDASCDICGFTREPFHTPESEWLTDETEHWRVCAECGEEIDIADHVPGPEATITAPQNCTVCGLELAPIIPHEHSYDPDDNTHRHKCECGHIYEADAEDCTICATPIPWRDICIAETGLFLVILLFILIAYLVNRKKRDY